MPQPEDSQFYAVQVTLTANQSLRNQKVPIEPDSDFELLNIRGTQTGTYTLNFQLPDGRMISNVPIRSDNIVGTATQPGELPVSATYKRAGIGPACDLVDVTGATNVIELVFCGKRKFSAA